MRLWERSVLPDCAVDDPLTLGYQSDIHFDMAPDWPGATRKEEKSDVRTDVTRTLFSLQPTQPTSTPSRAALQTRPLVQRALIRSWEYSRPVRITVLAIRLLVTMWLFVLTALLVSDGHLWA